MGFINMTRGLAVMAIAGLVTTALCAGSNLSVITAARDGAGLRAVGISADSALMLATSPAGRGLFAVDTSSGEAKLVSSGRTAGYGAAVSGDGQYIAYKDIDLEAGTQSPVVYNNATGKKTVLATAGLAGTPAISASGKVAYTVENELRLADLDGNAEASTFDLGHHVNLLSITASGDKVIYNDEDDQLIVLDLATGDRVKVTDDKAHYFAPKFSPDGRRVLMQTITGEVAVTRSNASRVRLVGVGENPQWLDDSTVSFTMKTVLEGAEVTETALLAVNISGRVTGILASSAGDATAVARGYGVAFAPAGQISPRGFLAAKSVDDGLSPTSDDLQIGLTSDGVAWTAPLSVALDESSLEEATPELTQQKQLSSSAPGGFAPQSVVDTGSTVYMTGVPYIHQNDDAPDWWNGNWSCNVTAALMGIQYYDILPKHPITATWPTPHTSDYGWYIPNVYTFNGHTYNIGSKDPNGTWGYGGYGYITQNNWIDTKGYMADYISFHGPSSGVDWSPNFSEALAEVNANHPFVILTSITSAGHYPLCIGYVKNQHTLIFNDPYGNKNTGQYPSPNGRNVWYDWPGYNNGYSNLNIVHCYIWCRQSSSQQPTIVVDNTDSGFSASSSWSTGTSASGKYGTSYRYRSTGAVSDAATWNFNVSQSGNYKVQVWYTSGSNRSATAPYIMPNGNVVPVNQQTGGGSWVTLGTQYLSAGSHNVRLSCWTTAGYVVIADAVRIVPQ